MGCMPYGQIEYLRREAARWVSIPHMGCMPYGPAPASLYPGDLPRVSIPHMGCMPYGQRFLY